MATQTVETTANNTMPPGSGTVNVRESGSAPAIITPEDDSAPKPVVSEIFGYVTAGKRSAAPRTALHQHFRDLTKVTEAGVSEIAKAVATNSDVAGLRATVTQHESDVKGLGQQVKSLLEKVTELGKVVGAGGANGAGSSDGAAPVFSERRKLCLRALNRIEDILLDKDPELASNNKELKRFRDDILSGNASEALQSIGQKVDEGSDWHLCQSPLISNADRISHFLACARLRSVVMTHPGLNSDPTE